MENTSVGSRLTQAKFRADKGEKLVLTLTTEATASLVSGKTEHNNVKLPAGTYDIINYSEGTEYAGSDYCWYTTFTTAWLYATKGNTERLYEVHIRQGGDAEKYDHGKITVEKTCEPNSIPSDCKRMGKRSEASHGCITTDSKFQS